MKVLFTVNSIGGDEKLLIDVTPAEYDFMMRLTLEWNNAHPEALDATLEVGAI